MRKSRKDLILKLHVEVSPSSKSEIEVEFPKLFKKDDLVVGKWYKSRICLFNYQKHSKVYGFFGDEGWIDENWTWSKRDSKVILATDEEVKQVLIKEAKKKGFKKGVKINNLESIGNMLSYHHHGISSNGSFYNISENAFWFMGKLIFWNGKWATIVEETITKEEAKVITDKIEVLKNELLNKTIV